MGIIRKIKHKIGNAVRLIYPLPAAFDDKKLKNRNKFKDDYIILANSLDNHLSFSSFIDVGCAQGLLLQPLYERGYNVTGIEVSETVAKYVSLELLQQIKFGDFSEANGSFDLVCCVEVAEHIRPTRSEELVNKLCKLSEEYVYFTAAPPGQDGHGHINCRPHHEWKTLFRRKSYILNSKLTRKLKNDLSGLKKAKWLKRNSMIFEKSC
jgi:SAM-dependent methyltransferase